MARMQDRTVMFRFRLTAGLLAAPGFAARIQGWFQVVILPEKMPAATSRVMLKVLVATPGMRWNKHT